MSGSASETTSRTQSVTQTRTRSALDYANALANDHPHALFHAHAVCNDHLISHRYSFTEPHSERVCLAVRVGVADVVG